MHELEKCEVSPPGGVGVGKGKEPGVKPLLEGKPEPIAKDEASMLLVPELEKLLDSLVKDDDIKDSLLTKDVLDEKFELVDCAAFVVRRGSVPSVSAA